MTTVNYLTKTELPGAFNSSNFDPATQQAVINQLIADGLYTAGPDDGKAVWVESDIFGGVLQPPPFGNPDVPDFVNVLEVESANATVDTDQVLSLIVDDGNGPNNILNVTGSNPVFIALGNSNTTVNLSDHGNDTVLGGGGNDSITANSDGNVVLYAGGGNDTLVGGGGADSLYAGAGHDILTAGTGHHQLLVGGSGSSELTDLSSGGTDTLIAGTGNDTLTGVQGDQFLLPSGSMAASGNNVYNIYDGSGNSTINLGTGADSVSFFTTQGNDTLTNSGGHDTINYTGASTSHLTDIQSITPRTGANKGDYTINFKDGQQVELQAHSLSSSQVAFTLQFTDGTLNLKGGS